MGEEEQHDTQDAVEGCGGGLPVGLVAATTGTASAGKFVDSTLAPATASCTSSGGTLTFKVVIGLSGGAMGSRPRTRGIRSRLRASQ